MLGILNSNTNRMTPLTLPTKLHFIKNQTLAQILISEGSSSKMVLFLEERVAQASLLYPVIEKMSQNGNLTWVKEVSRVLTPKAILKVLNSLELVDAELFLAIGDDKVLDLAKSVAACKGSFKKIETEVAILSHLRTHSNRDHFDRVTLKAILTTPECGSALMGWITVFDEATLTLSVYENPSFSYDEVSFFMDETLILSPRQVLTTGLKSLSQASEALWFKESKPSIQNVSLNAIRRIVKTLPILLKNSAHPEARKQMMIGSLMASFAFSNTQLSVATSIGLALESLSSMDIGLASALVLPDLLRYNLGALNNLESLYEAFDINNPEALGLWIENNAKGLMSVKPADYGITEETLIQVSWMAVGLDKTNNNAIEITQDQILDMLKRHY